MEVGDPIRIDTNRSGTDEAEYQLVSWKSDTWRPRLLLQVGQQLAKMMGGRFPVLVIDWLNVMQRSDREELVVPELPKGLFRILLV